MYLLHHTHTTHTHTHTHTYARTPHARTHTHTHTMSHMLNNSNYNNVVIMIAKTIRKYPLINLILSLE